MFERYVNAVAKFIEANKGYELLDKNYNVEAEFQIVADDGIGIVFIRVLDPTDNNKFQDEKIKRSSFEDAAFDWIINNDHFQEGSVSFDIASFRRMENNKAFLRYHNNVLADPSVNFID